MMFWVVMLYSLGFSVHIMMYTTLKHWLLPTRLHGTTVLKAILDIFTAIRTWNPKRISANTTTNHLTQEYSQFSKHHIQYIKCISSNNSAQYNCSATKLLPAEDTLGALHLRFPATLTPTRGNAAVWIPYNCLHSHV